MLDKDYYGKKNITSMKFNIFGIRYSNTSSKDNIDIFLDKIYDSNRISNPCIVSWIDGPSILDPEKDLVLNISDESKENNITVEISLLTFEIYGLSINFTNGAGILLNDYIERGDKHE